MNFTIKTTAFLAATLVWSATQAHASVVQITSATALSPTDTTLQYTNPVGSTFQTNASFSAGGNTLRFTSSIGGAFEVDQANYNYGQTAFPNGTRILGAGGFQGASAPVTISLATPVTEFGFNTEEFNDGAFVVTFQAFDGQRLLGQFTAGGVSGRTLSFEGLQASGGDQITSLSVSDNNGNDLLFGPVTFGTPSAPVDTPEPASLLLFAAGIVGLGVLRNRPARDA